MPNPPEKESPSKPIEKAHQVADHLKQNDSHALTELNQDLRGMKAQDRQQFFHTLANDAASSNGLPGLEITNTNNKLKVSQEGGAVLYDENALGNAQSHRARNWQYDRHGEPSFGGQRAGGEGPVAPAERQPASAERQPGPGEAPPPPGQPAAAERPAPAERQPAPTDAQPTASAPGAQSDQDLTPKLRAGEGPYQALHRQHPDWNDHQLKEQAHKILAQTGRNSFKQGEQFKMNTDGSVTSHLDNKSKDGSYTETTSKDGKPVGDKVHMTTNNGYTEVERTATGAKQTTHTDDGQGGYKEHSESSDGTVSDTSYDPTTKVTHTETTDKDKNKTVKDANSDGSYTSTTTDVNQKQTHSESVDKNQNKTSRDTNPTTGAYQETTTDAQNRQTRSESKDAAGTTVVRETNPDTGVYTETTKDSAGHQSDVTHTPTSDGYTEVAHKNGATINTTHTDTGNGNYKEHAESSDGSSSVTTYDKTAAKSHTETIDKDGNKTELDKSDDGSSTSVTTDSKNRQTKTESVDKNNNTTVRDINPDNGTYNEVTTNSAHQQTRTETLDKDKNKTVKETDPATGAYTERVTDSQNRETHSEHGDANGKTVRDTNPKNGSYKEVTTDSHGTKTDEKTHTKLAKGFIDTERIHSSGGAEKTSRTVHVDDGHGGYREMKSDSDGNRSTSVFDSATNKTHTESTDNAYHRTVRDDNNKDSTYTEKTTDGWGAEIRSESMDQSHNKTVRETDPKTKAYKETTTDSNNSPISGSHQDADGSKGSWKINADGSHLYTTEAHGHRSENTFQGGHLTQSVDTDTKSGVVKTAVHKDGQVITTTHTPGQAQDTVETAPEVAVAGAAS